MHSVVAKYPPMLNHALIFNTDGQSFHDFRNRSLPEGQSRKSVLAFYYYTAEPTENIRRIRPTPVGSPTDGAGKKVLIWLDKKGWCLLAG